MDRHADREIQSWRRRPVRDQLRLLWKEERYDKVKLLSYWDTGPWSSPYVVLASQAGILNRTRRSLAEIDFEDRGRDATFLSNQEFEGPPPEYRNWDAREARFRLGRPGASEREELCDWLVAVGRRRDEIDIPLLRRYGGHDDHVVRYVSLGMQSWNPSVLNRDLLDRFGRDEDSMVRALARDFATGRLSRSTSAW